MPTREEIDACVSDWERWAKGTTHLDALLAPAIKGKLVSSLHALCTASVPLPSRRGVKREG